MEKFFKSFRRNRWVCCILFTAICLCQPLYLNAQVTIEEHIELQDKSTVSRQAGNNIQIQELDKPGVISFVTKKSGMLKLYFEDVMLYRTPLSEQNLLKVEIMNKEKHQIDSVDITNAFDDRIVTPLEKHCGGNFYLYGYGSFTYYSRFDEAKLAADTYIDRRNSDDNFGDSPEITIRKDRTLGLINFDLPSLPSYVKFEYASLYMYSLWATFSPDTYFSVSRVADSWEEHEVTWETRPELTDPTIEVPGKQEGLPKAYFYPDLRPFVRSWINNQEPNYGIGISVPEDAPDTRMYLNSSDAYDFNPGFKMLFSAPKNRSEKLFKIGEVAKGDTVIISYLNSTPNQNRAYNFDTNDKIEVGGRNIAFDYIDYLYSYNFPTSCWPYNKRAELLNFYSVIERANLELSMEVPEIDELWPTIPSDGVQSNFDRSQVENNVEEIVVEVTQNDEPAIGYPVTIKTEWVPGSGGHDHNGNGDLQEPPPEKMGWIVNIEEDDSAQGKLMSVTNIDGQIRLRYRTPEFGGKVRLIAEAVNSSGNTLRAEKELTVKVPGLVQLEEGSHYKKVGGISSHHGPRLDTQNAFYLSPDHNHYGSEAFVDTLISISNTWQELVTENSTQDDRQTPLNINDMSLPNGGKFDIEGKFLDRAAYHANHRVGLDVDIRTTRSFPIYPTQRNGVLLERKVIAGEEQYLNESFENLWLNKGAAPSPEIHGKHTEGTEHYHIYFYN